MGAVLQIRVSAYTYRTEDVCERWPRLCAMAGEYIQGEPEDLGLLEMIQALDDALSFGEVDKDARTRLGDGKIRMLHLRMKLEAALGDWLPKEADAISYDLEATLDAMEKEAP